MYIILCMAWTEKQSKVIPFIIVYDTILLDFCQVMFANKYDEIVPQPCMVCKFHDDAMYDFMLQS